MKRIIFSLVFISLFIIVAKSDTYKSYKDSLLNAGYITKNVGDYSIYCALDKVDNVIRHGYVYENKDLILSVFYKDSLIVRDLRLRSRDIKDKELANEFVIMPQSLERDDFYVLVNDTLRYCYYLSIPDTDHLYFIYLFIDKTGSIDILEDANEGTNMQDECYYEEMKPFDINAILSYFPNMEVVKRFLEHPGPKSEDILYKDNRVRILYYLALMHPQEFIDVLSGVHPYYQEYAIKELTNWRLEEFDFAELSNKLKSAVQNHDELVTLFCSALVNTIF